MSRESKFTADLTRLLRSQGAVVAPYIASTHGVAGWPDRCVWSTLWCGHMELKTGDRQCTPKQLHILRELDRRRAWSAVEVRECYEGMLVNKTHVCVIRYHWSEGKIMHIVRRDELLRELNGWSGYMKVPQFKESIS